MRSVDVSGGSSKGKGDGSAEEARLRTIIDAMVEAVYVTDPKGRVTMTNRALDALVARDVRGRRAKNVIKHKELKVAIRRARKKNKATDVELETTIGERVHSFHAQVSPLPGDAGVVTVLHDVTTLKDADRIRRDFVANASHELRTPLTAVRGFTETLLDGADADPVARKRFLDAILRHTLRLQRLAEDLTLLTQAESPQRSYEAAPLDVGALIRDTVASLEPFASSKEVDVVIDAPRSLVRSISARAVEPVLINLVENAIKYSPPGGRVDVRVSEDGEQLCVEVRDRGPGIPPEEHERIFERFYRVDEGRSRAEGGTGLGLSIAKNLVQRVGGTIEVESEVGEGTLFRVTVPIEGGDEDE